MNDGLTYLKIKNKTLAYEARIIRNKERDLIAFSQCLSYKQPTTPVLTLEETKSAVLAKLFAQGITEPEIVERITKKAVKAYNRNQQIAHKAARFVGKNNLSELINKTNNLRENIYKHRKNIVRPEARATQIAIAFIRGYPYDVVETKYYDEGFGIEGQTLSVAYKNFWDRVVNIVKKYSNIPKEKVEEQVFAWRDSHPQLQK